MLENILLTKNYKIMKEDYLEFLEKKKRKIIQSGFDVSENELNTMLFDFQKFIVKIPGC